MGVLVRITGRAEVTGDDGGVVTDRWTIHQLNGVESGDDCANYVDSGLADLEVSGGAVKLSYDSDVGQFRVSSEYTAPAKLNPAQLDRLAQETVGQWCDGIGEGCFEELAERLGVVINLSPLAQNRDLRVEQVDDGKEWRKPKTGLAKAAREGDMTALRRHLDSGADTEYRLQGYTALHLAILYGHADTALELIERGADINARDPNDEDPLMLAALSNSITDADAALIARALLERGLAVYGPRGPEANPVYGEYTPMYMAKNRKKTKLAAVLQEFGALK